MFPFVYFLKILSYKQYFYFKIGLCSVSIFVLFYLFNYLFIKDKYLTDFVDQERSSALLKLFVITIYYFLTSLIIRKNFSLVFEQRMRFALYIFLIVFSAYGELFSRFLYFFSGFEVIFFYNVLMSKSISYGKKMFYTILFLTYNFLSLNVINVFWLEFIELWD
jgi:hypothetical protein